MNLLPSDIARLVLGYLKENGLKKTFVAFLQESHDLSEYWRVLNSGKVPTTTVMGHSLQTILEEYASLKLKLQVLDAKLGLNQNPGGASTSHDITATDPGRIEQSDIDAVLESHRKAELNRERKLERRRAKAKGDYQGKKSLPPRAETSSLPQTHELPTASQTREMSQTHEAATSPQIQETSQTHERVRSSRAKELSQPDARQQSVSRKKDDILSKSADNDEHDDDFEFDSLDRLLADTKLHEKLAESINKALKRDQTTSPSQLVSPSVSSAKKSDVNQSELGGGNNSSVQDKESSQKDTSAVVDDIISMTAGEPGLEQLLSLFQYPPEPAPKPSLSVMESPSQSAPLYIPEIDSKKMDSHSFLSPQSKSSGHAFVQLPHSDHSKSAPITENFVNVLDTPRTETAVASNTLEHSLQSEKTHQHPSSFTAKSSSTNSFSTVHTHVCLQSSSKDNNVNNAEGNLSQEQREIVMRGTELTVSTNEGPSTSMSNVPSQRVPCSPVKSPNARNNRKGYPKKLFKEGEINSHRGVHLNEEGRNKASNSVTVIEPVKKHVRFNEMTHSTTNTIDSHHDVGTSRQSGLEGSPNKQSQNPFTDHTFANYEKDSFKNHPIQLENIGNVVSSKLPSHIDIPIPSSSSHSRTNISPSSHSLDKNNTTQTTTHCQSTSSTRNMLAPPQNVMEDNSLSVFSLINKCTQEIIGAASFTSFQDRVEDHKNKDDEEREKSKHPEEPLQQSFKIESCNENEKSPEQLNSFESSKGRNRLSTSSIKQQITKDEYAYKGTFMQLTKEETPTPSVQPDLTSDLPGDRDVNYDSDSSFDTTISTPNAVHVKPVNLSGVPSTRERNYQMVDTYLQDVLKKLKASSGDAHGVESTDQLERSKRNSIDQQQESDNKEEKKSNEERSMVMDSHICDEARVEPGNNQIAPEKEARGYELRIRRRLTEHSFPEMEGLHNCSATISTPFVTKTVVNTDNSPRKLMEDNFKNRESVSMPASFPSSLREKCDVKGQHNPNDCCSSFSPSVSKFHPKSKENFSPTAANPLTSRKVIACSIAHSPVIPSHLKRKGPSRRITPTEVSFSTPSPLGLMSPSSPAEFIIDMAQSPRQPNTPARESKTKPIEDQEKDTNGLKESLQTSVKLRDDDDNLRNSQVKLRDDDENLQKENDSCVNAHIPDGISRDASSSSAAPKKDEPAASNAADAILDTSLPPSPSQRKPRRVVPTLLSKTVSKVGGDIFFSSSSCSQSASLFQQDESKIVSSSSDPASPHSEAEAFRQLKTLIFGSYTKPQPAQEITSSNITKVRHALTPRKCGCGHRDVCTHGMRTRHMSTPMRKCGCISRDICTHVKGKGRKVVRKHSTSFSKSKEHDNSEISDSKISNVAENNLEQDVAKICGDDNSDSKNNEKYERTGDKVQQATEFSLSCGSFIAVGTVQKNSGYDNPLDDQGNVTVIQGTSDNVIDNTDALPIDCSTKPDAICLESSLQSTDPVAQHTGPDEHLMPEQMADVENNVYSHKESGSSIQRDSDDNVDNNLGGGDSKASSKSSNENFTHVGQSSDFDHHEPISLAAPYFPELSNTFDFFKLKNQNLSETERVDSAMPPPTTAGSQGNDSQNILTMPNISPVPEMSSIPNISPLSGLSSMPNISPVTRMPQETVQQQSMGQLDPQPGVNQSENVGQEDPHACLLSQAMEECGIPFEPGEQTMMELSHFVGMNDGGVHNNNLVNTQVQEDMLSTQEPHRMRLRSSTGRNNENNNVNNTTTPTSTTRGRKKKESTQLKPSQLPQVLPLTSSSRPAQPQIILPAQSQNPNPALPNAPPAPMVPGTIAYYSRPNLPPVPFTLLADGRVVVLSDKNTNNASSLPLQPPQPQWQPNNNNLPSLLPAPSIAPTPYQNSYSTFSQPITPQPIPPMQPVSTQPFPWEPNPPQPVSAQPVPIQITTTNTKTSVITNSKPKPSQQSCSSKTKKSDIEHSASSKERKKSSEKVKKNSAKVKKKEKKDIRSSNASKAKKDSPPCTGSMQKVAMRRKIGDITSSPKKASVSTYFRRPTRPAKRKLSLAAQSSPPLNSSNDEKAHVQGDASTKDTTSDVEEADLGKRKRNVGKRGKGKNQKGSSSNLPSSSDAVDDRQEDSNMVDQGDSASLQPLDMNYDIESETQRACDLIAMLNGELPDETSGLMDYNSPSLLHTSPSSPSQHGISPSKHVSRLSHFEDWSSTHEKSPSKQGLSPSKHERTPSKQGLSPSKQERTPSKQGLSPSKQERTPSKKSSSPSKQERTPSKQSSSPSKQERTPSKQSSSPSKQERTPSKQSSSPSKQERTPSKQGLSPSKHKRTPSKQGSSPSKQERTPSEQSISPSKHERTPSKHEKTPSKQGVSPSKQSMSPAKLSSALSSHVSSPSKHRIGPSKFIDMVENVVHHVPEVAGETKEISGSGNSSHVENGEGNSEDKLGEHNYLEKFKILSSLLLRKKEPGMSFSSAMEDDKSTEKVSSLVKGNNLSIDKDLYGKEDAAKACKEMESSSSHETESGSSLHGRLHSTPVNEAFYDDLDSIAAVEDEEQHILDPTGDKNCSPSPSSPVKEIKIRSETSHRKSFSDILRGVSLLFTDVVTPSKRKRSLSDDEYTPFLHSRRKRTRALSSDEDEVEHRPTLRSRENRRVMRIRDSSTSSGDSDNSNEDSVEANVSSTKVIKGKSISINSSKEDPVETNISSTKVIKGKSISINSSKEDPVEANVSSTKVIKGKSISVNSSKEDPMETNISSTKVIKGKSISINSSKEDPVKANISSTKVIKGKSISINSSKEDPVKANISSTKVIKGKSISINSSKEDPVKANISSTKVIKGKSISINSSKEDPVKANISSTKVIKGKSISINSSKEDTVEAKISSTKVIKGKSISITTSYDGDLITDIYNSSMTIEEYINNNTEQGIRRCSGGSKGKARSHQNKRSSCETKNSESFCDRKSDNLEDKLEKRQNTDQSGDQNNSQKVISTKYKSSTTTNNEGLDNVSVSPGKNRKRKAKGALSLRTGKRYKADHLADDPHSQTTEQETKETEITSDNESRNLFKDNDALSKGVQTAHDLSDSSESNDGIEEEGLVLLSSVALNDQSFKLSKGSAEYSNTSTAKKGNFSETHPKDESIGSFRTETAKSEGGNNTPVSSKSSKPQSIASPQPVFKETFHSSSIIVHSKDSIPSSHHSNTSIAKKHIIPNTQANNESKGSGKTEPVAQSLNQSEIGNNAPVSVQSLTPQSIAPSQPSFKETSHITSIVSRSKDAPPHSPSIVSHSKDAPSHSPSIVSHSKDAPPHSPSIVSHSKDVPPHSPSIVSHSKDAPPHSSSIISHSKDAPPHSPSIISHSKDAPPHSSSIVSRSKDAPPHSPSIVSHSKDAPPHSSSIVSHSKDAPPHSSSIVSHSKDAPPHSSSVVSLSKDSAHISQNGCSSSGTPTQTSGALSQPVSSPSISLPSSQSTSGSGSKGISKKKINKLISKLYKTPPPPPPPPQS